MQNWFIRISKMVLSVILLFIYSNSYGVAAYIPQTLRECISVICEKNGSQCHKHALEELYSAIKENRMLVSDAVVRRGIKEALEVVQASHKRGGQGEMIEYLEQCLKNLNDKAILLTMEGNASLSRSWSAGLIERCMRDQQESYELLRLSNELSDNLIFCGSAVNEPSLDTSVIKNMKRSPTVVFKPNVMTNSQSLMPTMVFGGTGVSSAIINGWALSPARVTRIVDQPFPVNMQFVIPDDFAEHQPVSLELGFVVSYNGLPSGYANILVQAKYVESKHNFNIDDVHWTHTNYSGNIKIKEPSNPDDLKYMFVNIPLKNSHIHPQDFALISISRTMPTGGKTEYTGDLALVSSVFKYTSSTSLPSSCE